MTQPTQVVSVAKTSRGFSPWLIWGLGAAFFFAEYFARVSPSVMVADLMRDLHVDAMSLGSLSAFFYYAYISMQLPVGVLVDRFGPQRLLTIMAAVCAFGCWVFASATGLLSAELGRLLMGFGAAFAFVGSLKLATLWFPASRFGLLAGLTQALGMLGAAVGEAPVSIVVDHMGWRPTMLGMAGVFVLLSLLIAVIVRDKPVNQFVGSSVGDEHQGVLPSLRKVLRNPQSWINGAFAGLLYAPTAAFAELWGVSFFEHADAMTKSQAATAVSLIFIGWGVGGPCVGWFSDWLGRRKPPMLIAASMCLLIITAVIYIPHLPAQLAYALLFVYGFFNSGLVAAYAVASENNPRSIAGASLAFANMASVLVGAAFQPLIGWFLDRGVAPQLIHGLPVYAASSFRTAMIALPLSLVLALLVGACIKETYCKPYGR